MEHMTELIDEDKCVELLEQWHWPDGVRCAHCESEEVIIHTSHYSGRGRRYRCKSCGRTFNSCIGTIFAQSRVSLGTWVACGYLMNCRLSKLEIAHELGVAPNTAAASGSADG